MKKQNFLFIRCCSLILSVLFSSITFGQQNRVKIKVDSHGDVVAFGSFHGAMIFNNGDSIGDPLLMGQGFFLAKFDSSGNTIWTKHLKSTSSGGSYIALDIDKNDNIIISSGFLGTLDFGDTVLNVSGGQEQTFIVKLNKNGGFIWSQTGNQPTYSANFDIVVDTSGNIYATGMYVSLFSLDTLSTITANGNYNIYITKLDSNGNGIWLKQINNNGTGSIINLSSIAIDKTDKIYITGNYGYSTPSQINLNQLFVTATNFYQIFIAKLSSDGTPNWLRRIDGVSGSDYSTSIEGLASGYLLGGYFSQAINTSPFLPLSAYPTDLFISQFDTIGNAKWIKQGAPNQSSTNNQVKAMAITTGGDFFTAGQNIDTLIFPPLSPFPANSTYFAKHDSIGGGICITGLQYWYWLSDITTSPSGSLYAASYGPEYFAQFDFVLSKWDDACNHLWDSITTSDIYLTIDEIDLSEIIKVYPNPTTDQLNRRRARSHDHPRR